MSIVRSRKCHKNEQLRFVFCFSFWVTCRHDLGVVPMIFAPHPTEKISLDPNHPMFFTLMNFSSLSIFFKSSSLKRLWEKELFNSARKKKSLVN